MLAKAPFGNLSRLSVEAWEPVNRNYRSSDSMVTVSTDLVIVPIPTNTEYLY